MIPYGHQSISEADVAAVADVLRSEWLTQGPAVPRFEADVVAATGAPHAVAVSSGTAALHLACLAAGLAPGGLLWTSPITFVASANCARYCGADVDFVDIDPATGNMSTDALEAKLEAAEQAGRLPDVLVPVDFAGQPSGLQSIRGLAGRYGFVVIEDASHALGATYRGRAVGSGVDADMTVFSFHPVKIVTTGEGGMVVARDEALADRVRLLREHGITRDERWTEGVSDGPWSYEQVHLGYNYRMTDMQAALGSSQMTQLPVFVARRAELADRYDSLLSDLPVTPLKRAADSSSAWHLYVVRIDEADRRAVYDAMRAAGIGVQVHYIPVHLQPYYRRLGFAAGDFPEAEAFYSTALTLPLYPSLSEDEQDRVVAALTDALG